MYAVSVATDGYLASAIPLSVATSGHLGTVRKGGIGRYVRVGMRTAIPAAHGATESGVYADTVVRPMLPREADAVRGTGEVIGHGLQARSDAANFVDAFSFAGALEWSQAGFDDQWLMDRVRSLRDMAQAYGSAMLNDAEMALILILCEAV